MSAAQIHRILTKLEQAKGYAVRCALKRILHLDRKENPRLFGSSEHKWIRRNVVAESMVEEWEAANKVRLPVEYREYLTKIGDGGVGPNYGIEPLFLRSETSRDYTSIMKPNPLRDKHYASFELMRDELARDGWLNQVNDGYPPEDGTLAISDIGCGIFAYLIVTGNERGKIFVGEWKKPAWFYPQKNFLDWYESWLEYVLTGTTNRYLG